MEIKINIPDEYGQRDIYIFAGIDIVARRLKRTNDTWEVKTKKCARCGRCCMKMTGKSFPFSTPDGCRYLMTSGNEYLCGLGHFRPNGCAVAELELEYCTVEWKSIK